MKHFVTWTSEEVEALRPLAAQGMSTSLIAAALTQMGGREFTKSAILGKIRRLEEEEGRIRPALPTKCLKPGRKPKPKAARPYVAPQPRKRSTTAGRQRQSILGIMANSAYQPASVIAGFPTIQIRKDREGNPLAPVTLRRVDLSGAHA